MGLGPHSMPLLQRINAPEPMWSNPFAMQMEAQARGEARQLKRIWHQQRHATPRKPEAPVRAMTKEQGEKERFWCWIGEDVPSKGIIAGKVMKAAEIRKAGYKLPKLEKPEAKRRAKRETK